MMAKLTHMRVPFHPDYDQDMVSDITGVLCLDESLTEQSEAIDTDINVLMERFGVTGQMPEPRSLPLVTNGDFVPTFNYQTAMNVIREAQLAFGELPADVRARFDHDPAKFVAYCSPSGNDKVDEKRLVELREWGLAVPEKPVEAEPPPMAVRVVNDAPAKS